MKTPLLLSSALALGLVAGALSVPQFASAANEPAAVTRMDGERHGLHHGEFRDRHMRMMPFEHVDGGLAFLKTELKITPEQEKAWAPFEAAVREQASQTKAAFEARKNDKDARPNTVPDRLNAVEQRLEKRLAAVKALESQTNALYASLSDDQKKTADNLLPSPMLPFPL